ncbi:hypothetical protein ElyMa_003616700 [Elysia marginata]|uniref:Fibrinogen C-terminal domain-containing protein n=1 Tax=Elysia marginata TaxID=1093978 RepID=A0AAV4ETL7_9GAST|nr:hypothetical protein ElyMa_003616700 [Elysia marginata]
MARESFFIVLFFGVCNGLDFTLKRENPVSATARNLCGILTCEEEIKNNSVSSKSDGELAAPDVGFNSISEMSMFKIGPTVYGNAKSKHKALIASITSQSPGLSSVANGRKIDGLLDTIRGSLRVELVKEEDCKAEFICQVRGLDIQGRQAVSTTNLVQHTNQAENLVDAGTLTPRTSVQLLGAIQQLITQSTDSLNKNVVEKITSLENRIEDKLSMFENRVEDKLGISDNKIEEKVSQLQKDFDAKSDTFEHRIDSRLDVFENRVENKIDDNNNLNKLMQLDFKVSKKLDQFQVDANATILNSLDTMRQRLYSVQNEALKNVSDSFDKTLNNTSSLLTSIEEDFQLLKNYGPTKLIKSGNETEDIRDLLTSGEVLARCVENDNTDSYKDQLVPLTCHRGMANEVNKSYPHYIMMTDFTLQRQILCDTQTDGGGWTVIQVNNVLFVTDSEAHAKHVVIASFQLFFHCFGERPGF